MGAEEELGPQRGRALLQEVTRTMSGERGRARVVAAAHLCPRRASNVAAAVPPLFVAATLSPSTVCFLARTWRRTPNGAPPSYGLVSSSRLCPVFCPALSVVGYARAAGSRPPR